MLISWGRKEPRLSPLACLGAAAGRVCGQTSSGTGAGMGQWAALGLRPCPCPFPGLGKCGKAGTGNPWHPLELSSIEC